VPGMVGGPDIAVCGPMARSAGDLALAMDLLAGPEPLDRPGWRLDLPRPVKTSLRELRVALWPSDPLAPVEQEIADRVAEVGETLAKLGATVSDVARPSFDPREAHLTYVQHLSSIMGSGLPEDVFEAMRREADALPPDDDSERAISLRATVLTHRDWIRADHARERLRYAWRGFFDEWDVLICPQTATTAFPHDHGPMSARTIPVDGEQRPYFEQLFWAGLATASYLPSTVFPTGASQRGLPIGLQAIGPEYDDLRTIDFARMLAREIGGFVPPPIHASA